MSDSIGNFRRNRRRGETTCNQVESHDYPAAGGTQKQNMKRLRTLRSMACSSTIEQHMLWTQNKDLNHGVVPRALVWHLCSPVVLCVFVSVKKTVVRVKIQSETSTKPMMQQNPA
jgi:hypothetical protein